MLSNVINATSSGGTPFEGDVRSEAASKKIDACQRAPKDLNRRPTVKALDTGKGNMEERQLTTFTFGHDLTV